MALPDRARVAACSTLAAVSEREVHDLSANLAEGGKGGNGGEGGTGGAALAARAWPYKREEKAGWLKVVLAATEARAALATAVGSPTARRRRSRARRPSFSRTTRLAVAAGVMAARPAAGLGPAVAWVRLLEPAARAARGQAALAVRRASAETATVEA